MSAILRLIWSVFLVSLGLALGWGLCRSVPQRRALGTRLAGLISRSPRDHQAGDHVEPRRSLADAEQAANGPLDLQAFRIAKQLRERPTKSA